jgi:hypothetical protein
VYEVLVLLCLGKGLELVRKMLQEKPELFWAFSPFCEPEVPT